jgi:CheY-like chemotaxis protein
LPHILLVEDEKPVRDIVVLMLLCAGFDCREAADGSAAMDLLPSGLRINLVMSNLLLPEVDGFTLLLHVKQDYPWIPFVVLTLGLRAFHSAVIVLRFMLQGYSDVLVFEIDGCVASLKEPWAS